MDNLEAVILFLYNQVNEAEYEGASKFKALKLLYQLKEELPEDHPLQETLPFYWYKHGPYSDGISEALDTLTGHYLIKVPYDDKFIFKVKTDGDLEEIAYDHDVIDPEVIRIIRKLMERDVFEDIESIVYSNAPYPFMPLYKLELWKQVEEYKNSVVLNDENPDLIESAIELGYKCETGLPFESYYSTYDDLFSNFLTSFDRIYQNEMTGYYNRVIVDHVKKVWYTFAYGLRVKNHEKTQLYDNQERKWDIQFQKELRNLNSDLKKFREMARKSSRGNKVEFSTTSKKILSSTIGTYIK